MTTPFRLLFLIIALAASLVASDSRPCALPARPATETSQTRAEEISALISIVRNEHIQAGNPECTTSAIYRLGTLRATQAVQDLAALLGFRRKFASDDSPIMIHVILEEAHYPAAEALVNIGKPALPVLESVISAEEHQLDSRTQCSVLCSSDSPRFSSRRGQILRQSCAHRSFPGIKS